MKKNQKDVNQNNQYLEIFRLICTGKNQTQCADIYNISRPAMYKKFKVLERLGCIKKISYGVWYAIKEPPKDVNQRGKGYKQCSIVYSSKDIKKEAEKYKSNDNRKHALAFKIQYPQRLNIKKIEYRLDKTVYPKKYIRNNKAIKTNIRGFGVEFNKKSLLIYFPKHLSIFSKKAIIAFNTSFMEAKKVMRTIEKDLKLNFKINGRYRIKQTKSEWALIKNHMAKILIDKFGKFSVKDERGEWAVVDNSFDLNEFEITRAGYEGKNKAEIMQRHFNQVVDLNIDLRDVKEMVEEWKEKKKTEKD